MKKLIIVMVAGLALVGCDPECSRRKTPRVEALEAKAWSASEWISVKAAKVAGDAEEKHQRAADGTSCFARRVVNAKAVKSAKWMATGLGVFDLYVNGQPVGTDFLKPGFTHFAKTKYAFTYDVTALLKTGAGEANDFGAEVSAGWWRDKIVNYMGKKSAFRAVIELTYEDGAVERVGTKASEWFGEVAGPVTHAAIFDGEEYDARLTNCARKPAADFTAGGCELNDEFKGEILPTSGAEIRLRCDKAMRKGAQKVVPGQSLVLDFGQNCAGVPFFRFRAKAGTVLTALPGEMLNDADKGSRGCDGPKGTLYRENLRMPADGMRIVYTFAGDGVETYLPRFTFFGYRYISLSATDEVEIDEIASVPVSSIAKEMELGTIQTGDAALNQFISNVYWGQLSNYLSVPTDCPQRNERLGWTADTQVFAEAGAFNANTCRFFHKWLRDMRDSQHDDGSYPSVAPFAQYGNEGHRLGWADAGVIVPYRVWVQFGDRSIIDENWDAMERFLAMQDKDCYVTKGEFQYADWLSFEDYEPCNGSAFEQGKDGKRSIRPDATLYWDYLAACYWLYDAQLMSEMAAATGRTAAAEKYRKMSRKARNHIVEKFVDKTDGLLVKPFRHLQSAAVFALKFRLLSDAAAETTKRELLKNIADHNGCLSTGFLGASFIMDALTENGLSDAAYGLLFQHNFPSWLYSVDQGATTVWERWNSYTKKDGFGPVGMNSFNHYAYGAVLAWIYRTAAGIAADPAKPGFRNIIMKPVPDRRLGFVKAEYKSAAGLIKSAWRYEGDKWIWDFTIPEGATASVTLPGETAAKPYAAGTYHIER